MSEPLRYVGNQEVCAVDSLEKVLGTARYIGDLSFPDMLYAKLLLSPHPHARIISLDTSPAREVQGVVAVLTSEDFKDHGNFGWPVKDAYVLAYQKVRYVGDPIAVVAATSLEAAVEGVRSIKIEYQPLEVVGDISKALDPASEVVPLNPPLGKGNLCERVIVRNGDPQAILDEAPLTLSRSYYFAHQEHAYLETEGVLAIPEGDGSLTIFANNQSPHINRDNAAELLEMAPDQVRIIQPTVGGSFGGKDDHVYQFTVQVGKLARLTGKPVRLVLNREESLIVSYKREAGRIDLSVGFDEDGTLLAGKGNFLVDSGAYASMTPLAAFRASMHLLGTYRYQAATVDTDVVYTNNGYSGAFRGFGNTQAAAASEMLIDEAAALFGRDPIDYRLEFCLRMGDQAFTGNTIQHQVGLSQALEWVRDHSDWDRLRREYENQAADALERRGLGVACYFHGSGLGGEGTDYARTTIEIERDHTVTLQSGLTDYGQGSRTVFSNLTAEVLGVDRQRVHMLRPDTQTALESGPTVASRASIVGGNATRVAAEKVLGSLLLAATDLLDCKLEQIYRQGELFIGPKEEPVSFEEVVDHAFALGLQLYSRGYWQIPEIHWDFESGTGIPYFTYSYGAQVAQVLVNRKEGSVHVERIWAAHDGGKIIFPKGARGQFLGGIAQGLGYALTEGFQFKDGVPVARRLSKYRIPTILDMPECETTFIETDLPEGPYGAKNLAEPVMIATAPAIANAIYHAVGVRSYQLPIRPDWLKDQIQYQGK